jgi:cytochrome c556
MFILFSGGRIGEVMSDELNRKEVERSMQRLREAKVLSPDEGWSLELGEALLAAWEQHEQLKTKVQAFVKKLNKLEENHPHLKQWNYYVSIRANELRELLEALEK